MINSDRLVKTFCDIVQIDSISGEEDEIAEDLTSRLESLGLTVEADDYGNLIANSENFDSSFESPPILLSVHMDTVDPGRGIKPQVADGVIRSDGTTIIGGDAKAGVAAVLEAIESINEDKAEHLPYQVCLTREEETGLHGARNLDFSKIYAKEAIVFDGEGPVNTVTVAAPTYIGFTIEITGRAAHAGVEPEKGLSAIRIAAELITRMPQGRLDEDTTFNIGLIEGGSVRNTVPEDAKIVGEFRSQNIETIDNIGLEIKDIISRVQLMYPDAELKEHLHTEFEHYEFGDKDPTYIRVAEAMSQMNLTPSMKSSGGGTDGNVFRLKGITSVVVGMADNGMHTVREHVKVDELTDAAQFCEIILKAEQ
ncbi:MAG: peptidase M20 [Dehalococcoidia bacterium]|nr:peptidase M20 [Dehalococcoidia bacterium]MQG15850.1 M20/M25/M40 family metallo-hydrolase [SAR202 cluster bacterium]|tara:strand:+ start:62899 stop:63999 length:1101 start_codon:yes stop_codon:yes gene_type:complete